MESYTLTLEDIFKTNGLYTSSSFGSGVCVEVEGEKIHLLTYEDVDDFFPTREPLHLYKGFLSKKFKRVYNRAQLFNEIPF